MKNKKNIQKLVKSIAETVASEMLTEVKVSLRALIREEISAAVAYGALTEVRRPASSYEPPPYHAADDSGYSPEEYNAIMNQRLSESARHKAQETRRMIRERAQAVSHDVAPVPKRTTLNEATSEEKNVLIERNPEMAQALQEEGVPIEMLRVLQSGDKSTIIEASRRAPRSWKNTAWDPS